MLMLRESRRPGFATRLGGAELLRWDPCLGGFVAFLAAVLAKDRAPAFLAAVLAWVALELEAPKRPTAGMSYGPQTKSYSSPEYSITVKQDSELLSRSEAGMAGLRPGSDGE